MNTYFEIGGHVIEHVVQDNNVPSRPPRVDVRSISKQTGVPAPLIRAGVKDVKDRTGIDLETVADSYSRVRRARWAFGTAATLAAADGPLPIGDAAAIGLLVVYGGYEAGTAIRQLL